MKKSMVYLNLAVILGVLWISACKPLISQDPSDTFWNKKFPKQLEWIRSQMREIPSAVQEKIVARVKADQQKEHLLKVAVIDSGVDVAHTDLIHQIDYRIANDRIVGAGYDIMGGGPFGSHVLVDPTLFAFGAESLRNGRIVNPPESPLKVLEQVNNRFRDLIITGIQNDPLLKESLFSKLNREAFAVFGFENMKSQPKVFLSSYEEHKNKGELISATTVPQGRKNKMILEVQNSWTVMSEDQRPEALDSIEFIEHADRFLDLLANSYNTLDKEFDFTKKVALYNEFKNTVEKKSDVKKDLGKFPSGLKKAMKFVLLGPDMYDPIRNLESMFKSQKAYRELSFEDAFKKYLNEKRAQLDALLKNQNLNDKDRLDFKHGQMQLDVLETLVENLIRLKKDPAAYTKMRSDIRRFVYRTKHPYIAEESNENSHATHVSGVIAKQHENIRIVPIRVTTQTISVAKDRHKEIVEKFMNDVKDFMETPYFQHLKNEISKEYGNIKMDDKTFFNKIKKYLAKNALNAIFIQNVLNAVEAAGTEQVKLANVSLGTTFKKNHALDKKRDSMAEDIFSEFARFKIGQTIQEKAPGTLFMIATGNDGGWLDGVSKTAFPVGITSMRLLKIAQQHGLPSSPNNAIKNVLAVGSINPNGTLTPFTNILLDPNIPQIFSTGEEIQSSVPAKSASPSQEIALGKTQGLLLTIQGMVKAQGKLDENLPMDEQIAKMPDQMFDMEFMKTLPESIATLLHVQEPINRALMSGTSMATPTVTGIIARYIAERMIKENIRGDQLYTHPNFKPEQIITDVMNMSRSHGLTSFITVKMLVDGIKTWNKPKGEATQKKSMNRLIKPSCETVFAM